MTARALRWLVLGCVLWTVAWAFGAWQSKVVGAGFMAAMPWLMLWLVLGLEFLAAAWSNRNDPESACTSQLLWAWCSACCRALMVFGWLQPFRALAWPDRLQAKPSRRGVVLIHGLACNRAFWTPWLRDLTNDERCFIALNLEPPWGPAERHVSALDTAVRRLHEATGLAPLLVCHSMGGLVARAWLESTPQMQTLVHHIVTLGTPHSGTALARADLWGLARQMRLDEAALGAQAQMLGAACRARFTCWYSLCDNIVFPATRARLPGASNRHAAGLGHVALAYDAALRRRTLALLTQEAPACEVSATVSNKSPAGDTGLDGSPDVT